MPKNLEHTRMKNAAIEQRSINTIRTLAMDAVQAANSGHPGTPMALAPAAPPLASYARGGWGPDVADALLARAGRVWRIGHEHHE
jgi:hypothetical protein